MLQYFSVCKQAECNVVFGSQSASSAALLIQFSAQKKQIPLGENHKDAGICKHVQDLR